MFKKLKKPFKDDAHSCKKFEALSEKSVIDVG
jgi:hypothetical protein